MKKFILSCFLLLFLSIYTTLAQINVNINNSLAFSDTNSNISFREILFSTSQIQSNSSTSGAAGYYIISNPNIFTNSFSLFVPAGTPNGSYFIAVRNNDTNGNRSDWSMNLQVNFFNKPSPPNGFRVITLP